MYIYTVVIVIFHDTNLHAYLENAERIFVEILIQGCLKECPLTTLTPLVTEERIQQIQRMRLGVHWVSCITTSAIELCFVYCLCLLR